MRNPSKICPDCGRKISRRQERCRACHYAAFQVVVKCGWCGASRPVKASYYTNRTARGQKDWYCNQSHKMLARWKERKAHAQG